VIATASSSLVRINMDGSLTQAVDDSNFNDSGSYFITK